MWNTMSGLGCGAADHASTITASASISTNHRGSMKPVTTIIELAGRTSANTSPVADLDHEAVEVRLPEDRADDRVDQVLGERGDQPRERQREDQADGDLDQVALRDELLELLDHRSSLFLAP